MEQCRAGSDPISTVVFRFVRCGRSTSTATSVLFSVPFSPWTDPLSATHGGPVESDRKAQLASTHAYANDTQIYGFCLPALSSCTDGVALWMRSNRLQLSTAKTEVLWCATSHRQHQIPQTPTEILVVVVIA